MHTDSLELLELYLELILARFGLLEATTKAKEPEEGVREAVSSIVYAAPRCEVRELHIVREALMSKFGREWAVSVMENTQGHVPSRVVDKCTAETPSKDWVDLYLFEIAKAYQVDWRPEGFVDLENHPGPAPVLDVDGDGEAEADTAAQEQRLREAALLSEPVQGEGKSRGASGEAGRGEDDDQDDDANGGDSAEPVASGSTHLPSAPSIDPKLGDVRNSTSSIPIVRSPPTSSSILPPSTAPTDGSSASAAAGDGGTVDLPAPPPFDPAQSARTVVIKSNLGASPSSAGQAKKPALGGSGDAAYDVRATAMMSSCLTNVVNCIDCADPSCLPPVVSQDLARRFEALKRK